MTRASYTTGIRPEITKSNGLGKAGMRGLSVPNEELTDEALEFLSFLATPGEPVCADGPSMETKKEMVKRKLVSVRNAPEAGLGLVRYSITLLGRTVLAAYLDEAQ
jgi:hypothetical protein